MDQFIQSAQSWAPCLLGVAMLAYCIAIVTSARNWQRRHIGPEEILVVDKTKGYDL